MENELNLNVKGDQEGKITILHGDADPAQREALPIQITGNITAVSAWIEQQPLKSTGTQSFVLVDVKEGEPTATIVFIEDGQSYFGTKVTGILEMDPDLKKLGINNGNRYTLEKLNSFLKLNRYLFPDREAHARLLGQIARFDADIQQKVQEQQVDRGNKGRSFRQNVTADIEPIIVLEIPIFKGEAKVKFVLEIAFDVTDGDVVFWLESAELKALIEEKKAEILDREVNLVKQKNLTVIYK